MVCLALNLLYPVLAIPIQGTGITLTWHYRVISLHTYLPILAQTIAQAAPELIAILLISVFAVLEVQVSCYPWVLFLYWLFDLAFSDKKNLIYLELTEPSASGFIVGELKVGAFHIVQSPALRCSLSLDFQDSFSM